MFGFKSAQQRRIDAKQSEIDGLKLSLEKEMSRAERIAGRLSISDRLCREAEIKLAEIRAERDAYRADALKFRASRSNLKQYRAKPNGGAAAVQGVLS